jgi:hypothetical protein
MGLYLPRAGEFIDLKDQTASASGSLQHVFAYPGRDDLLIKVVRKNFAESKWTGWRGWLKRRRRLGVLTSALRTITEHLAMRNAGLFPGRHLQEFVAVVETSEGIGIVVRAVRGRDGGYAPTLRTLLEQGRFTRETQALLDEFADWLISSPLIVGDLHVGNVVLAFDEEHGERLVLIDGMGEKNLVPLNTFFPGLNRSNTRDRLKRMREVIARRLAAAERAAPPASPSTP